MPSKPSTPAGVLGARRLPFRASKNHTSRTKSHLATEPFRLQMSLPCPTRAFACAAPLFVSDLFRSRPHDDAHPLIHADINRGYWTMTVSCLLCVTIPETPVIVTWYVPFGVMGFHCAVPPEPHPVTPNKMAQLNARPANNCRRRRDLKEKANPNRIKHPAGMKSPGDVVIVSGQVWGTAMFAVVNVEEVCDIGQPI